MTEVHCFDFSRRWPKHVRDREVRAIMRDGAPGDVMMMAHNFSKGVDGMGYLMALELLFRLGAALGEVMEWDVITSSSTAE